RTAEVFEDGLLGVTHLFQRVGEDGEPGGVEMAIGEDTLVVGGLSEGGNIGGGVRRVERGRVVSRTEDQGDRIPESLKYHPLRISSSTFESSAASYRLVAMLPLLGCCFSRLKARRRNMAMFCPTFRWRIRLSSSPNVTSSCQWQLFS